MFGPVQYVLLKLNPTSQFVTVTAGRSSPKASWGVVMYTMNNHTYNAMRV